MILLNKVYVRVNASSMYYTVCQHLIHSYLHPDISEFPCHFNDTPGCVPAVAVFTSGAGRTTYKTDLAPRTRANEVVRGV